MQQQQIKSTFFLVHFVQMEEDRVSRGLWREEIGVHTWLLV